MRRSALALVLPLVVLILGCGGSGSGGGGSSSSGNGGYRSGGGGSSSSGNGGASHQAVSFAKCRQLVGGLLFHAQHLPRIPKYTNAVASQCKRTPLRSTAFLQVYATAQVAKRSANGTSP